MPAALGYPWAARIGVGPIEKPSALEKHVIAITMTMTLTQPAKVVKLLGINIDENLNFSIHTEFFF